VAWKIRNATPAIHLTDQFAFQAYDNDRPTAGPLRSFDTDPTVAHNHTQR